jgi:energy-coupling factor transporter ATP-binding protein EcfA2
MRKLTFSITGRKIVIRLRDRVCESPQELLSSKLFRTILVRCLADLSKKGSPLLGVFNKEIEEINEKDIDRLIEIFQFLEKMPIELIPKLVEGSDEIVENASMLERFVEYLYNYWREHERFLICDSEGDVLDERPYRTFNSTVEVLIHLVRQTYRDIQENITKRHPNIYRQVNAGAEIAAIALRKTLYDPQSRYGKLNDIQVIRQILLYPPLLLNPPMNKRTGQFELVDRNPLDVIDDLEPEKWLAYPAKVGPLLIIIYFHERFFELGFSLCNLFELAEDDFLKRTPDAIYLFGTPGMGLDGMAKRWPTVFFEDAQEKMLVAAVPGRDEFGYFGYLKKMVLTLHNIKIMEQGKMPFHGAMARVTMRGNKQATILLIGDTATGKSETLEAFRILGEEEIQDMTIIADDMGSLDIDGDGNIIGYGTEIGAFVRLDDLQPGFAFGQLDRTIIMNPSQVNARVVLPVTTFEDITKGYAVDYIFYANNYEQTDEDHPIIDRIHSFEKALDIFREGTAMSKGTTTSTGLVHTYFANIFGPVQYRSTHEVIAKRYFEAFFRKGIFVGQLRTRLGLTGWERKGPEEAARQIISTIQETGDCLATNGG